MIDPYTQDPDDSMEYHELIEGAAAAVNFGENPLADWTEALLAKTHPEFFIESRAASTLEQETAEDIARCEVQLTILRKVTADTQSRLTALRG